MRMTASCGTRTPATSEADRALDARGAIDEKRPTFEQPGAVLARLAKREREREPRFGPNGWSEYLEGGSGT